jgi:hypothetical protein
LTISKLFWNHDVLELFPALIYSISLPEMLLKWYSFNYSTYKVTIPFSNPSAKKIFSQDRVKVKKQ